MAIIHFNNKKRKQFNQMYAALKSIAEDYYSVTALRAAAEARYGIPVDEAVDQAYENMRNDAKKAIRMVRPFKEKVKENELLIH